MKKITISHYLRKDSTQSKINGQALYAVYVQITVNRKTTQFKSNNPFSCLPDDKRTNNLVLNALKEEKRVLETIIRDLIKQGTPEFIKSENLRMYYYQFKQNENIKSDFIEIKELIEQKNKLNLELSYLKKRIDENETEILTRIIEM